MAARGTVPNGPTEGDRFVDRWALFVVASMIALFLVMGAADLLVRLLIDPLAEPPPSIYIYSAAWGIPWLFAALGGGWLFVRIRKSILKPQFPYLRRGYLVVLMAPAVVCAGLAYFWDEPAGPGTLSGRQSAVALCIVVQILMLTTAVVCAEIWRRFKLLD